MSDRERLVVVFLGAFVGSALFSLASYCVREDRTECVVIGSQTMDRTTVVSTPIEEVCR